MSDERRPLSRGAKAFVGLMVVVGLAIVFAAAFVWIERLSKIERTKDLLEWIEKNEHDRLYLLVEGYGPVTTGRLEHRDAWGTEIRYRARPNQGLELWSCGSDGADDGGTRDDVVRQVGFTWSNRSF